MDASISPTFVRYIITRDKKINDHKINISQGVDIHRLLQKKI